MTCQPLVLLGGGWHRMESRLTAAQHSQMQPLAAAPCICTQNYLFADTPWDHDASVDNFRHYRGVASGTSPEAKYHMTKMKDALSTKHVLTVRQ